MKSDLTDTKQTYIVPPSPLLRVNDSVLSLICIDTDLSHKSSNESLSVKPYIKGIIYLRIQKHCVRYYRDINSFMCDSSFSRTQSIAKPEEASPVRKLLKLTQMPHSRDRKTPPRMLGPFAVLTHSESCPSNEMFLDV